MEITDTEANSVELEASAILLAAGWSTVRVEQAGGGYLVAGTFQGQRHAGHTSIDPETSDDPRDMARRLVEIARGNAQTEPDDAGPVGGDSDPGPDTPSPDGVPDAPEPDDVASEAPPSGASSYPGGALIDQRLSEAVGALTSEYQNRVSQLDPKIGDANARIVALFGKTDRTEEETAELNHLYADVNGWTALRSRLTDHYVSMQSAMLQPGFDLAAFDPAYGWPS